MNVERRYLKDCERVSSDVVLESLNYKVHVGTVLYEYVKLIGGETTAAKVTGMFIDLPIKEGIKPILQSWSLFQ